MRLRTPYLNLLETSLNASSLRHNVIANNIANVDTPGYKRMEVDFERQLQKALSSNNIQLNTTNSLHITNLKVEKIKPEVKLDDRTSLFNNNNNVDIDYEMSQLAQNALWYQSLTDILNYHFSQLRQVITEGRR